MASQTIPLMQSPTSG